MGFLDGLKTVFGGLNPFQAVKESVALVDSIVDKYVTTPEEKEDAKREIREFQERQLTRAVKEQERLIADRASARSMASVHGKTQGKVSMVFVVAYFVVLVAAFGFIGFLIFLVMGNPDFDFPQWMTALVASTLGSVLTAMSLKLDMILGFLFGGSAGGDDLGAVMAETARSVEDHRTSP